jgi:chlorophyllide a reductase subunit Z
MILKQEKLPSLYVQVSFPGAVVRRATGTPHMGYAGAVWLLQVVCEALFDTLFANLPTSAVPPQRSDSTTKAMLATASEIVSESGKGRNSMIAWTDEAKALADVTLKRVPFFVRVSVNKKLRAEAESLARERGTDVDGPLVQEIVARFSAGR